MNPMEKFDAVLEQDIERLATEVREKAAGATPEAHKEAIKETITPSIYPEGKPAMPAVQPSEPSPVLPNYLQNAPSDIKLRAEKLVDLAWHKGIPIAVKEAKKAGSLYVDALHDALTDKLYEEFKKRKLI